MYLARDLELGMLRAVKELSITCRREARLLRLLEHPSLPQMIDYTERGEFCYIIMEYIRGKSLEQYLQEGRIFSVDEIIYMSTTILRVLQYFHSRKPAIFYGDLKPANLMLSDKGTLYLVDFGSAVFEYKVSYMETKGTRGYAAPEQLDGRITAASDLYALGKTMERFCGSLKIRYYIQCPALAHFIVRCCRADPEKRWKSTGEALAELKKIHPFKLKLKSVLIPTAAAVLALAIALSFGLTRKKNLPELKEVLSTVTVEYYSPGYRSGIRETRQKIYEHTEERLQKILKVYQSSEDQIRILELMAFNGELSDRADRAELYYRQLLAYEPEYYRGYLEYGMFLCRQKRYQDSREVYHQMQKVLKNVVNKPDTATEKEGQDTEYTADAWSTWEREAGIILGKKNETFLS